MQRCSGGKTVAFKTEDAESEREAGGGYFINRSQSKGICRQLVISNSSGIDMLLHMVVWANGKKQKHHKKKHVVWYCCWDCWAY